MQKPEPQLPASTGTALSALSETFSFHSSPETFIASRIAILHAQNPDLVSSRAVVRARILGRNVAIVSQHAQIRQILAQDEFVAADAYSQFMGAFFPSPNLLLVDGRDHTGRRKSWEDKVSEAMESVEDVVGKQVRQWVDGAEGEVDLYEELKRLSWRILLGLFLDLEGGVHEFAELVRLQEDLLRGQFSMFPVSVNVGFWHSPRKRGIDSMKKAQALILARVKQRPNACPFHVTDEVDTANHLVLFTSSLAVKALASLLMAYLLNIFLFTRDNNITLNGEVDALDGTSGDSLLRSTLLETERLSPPIVGIMRRCTHDTTIPSRDSTPDVRIPKGWDVWLYFVGGGRDKNAFGEGWSRFAPERFVGTEERIGFGFGDGAKVCLGRGIIRRICVLVAQKMRGLGVALQGEVQDEGVRTWLGWEGEEGRLEAWARDVKQLPTQHPVRPVRIRLVR